MVASFDGGAITSDAGALLGQTDRAIRLTERFAACFADTLTVQLVEHRVETMVMQRVIGIALGYEDLNHHDDLRHDPALAVLAAKLEDSGKPTCAPLAGKSTLNRLELSRAEPTRYHKISHHPAVIENLFVDLFLEAHKKAPKQIILDLDATDDPLHGNQEGRFFHGLLRSAIAICRFYIFSRPPPAGGQVAPLEMPMPQPARSRRSPASSPRSAAAGHARAFCCAAISASRASL